MTGPGLDRDSRAPLRVAWIGGPLPQETGHFALLGRELDLLVVSSGGPGRSLERLDLPGVQHVSLTAYGPHQAMVRWIYPHLGRTLSEFRPDVVHVVSEPWGLLAVQAAAWTRRHPSVALVLHGCERIWWHGGRAERRAKQVLARYTLGAAAGFCAETMAVGERAAESGLRVGRPLAQIHTNPRDPQMFRPGTAEQRRAARQRLGLPEEGAGVGFLGRLIPEKGPLLLVDAWAALSDEVRGSGWLALAGEGPLAQELSERVAALPGAHFLGGIAFPEDVVNLCRAAEIMAVPSYTAEGFDDQSPRTVIEGLLSGSLVVGSRSGGIPVMLGGAGVLVTEHNTDDLRRGLEQVLRTAGDPQALAAASTAAVAQGQKHYTTTAVTAQLQELWERCLSR